MRTSGGVVGFTRFYSPLLSARSLVLSLFWEEMAGCPSRILLHVISSYSAKILTFGEVTMETRHGGLSGYVYIDLPAPVT